MNSELKQPRILIVDDIVVNLKLLRQILRNDYQVSFAINGVKALEVMALQKPDLILLDIMMPEMDGFEVCQRVKSNPETTDIPIIFITANEEMVDAVKACKYGGVDYIIKPVNALGLLEKLRLYLPS